jgi:cytochrome c oxidase subunit 2
VRNDGWSFWSPALPPLAPHSSFTRPIAELMWTSFAVCAVVLAVVCVLVAICLVRFREGAAGRHPAPMHGDKRLEIVWTVVPILIVASLFGMSAQTMAVANPAPDKPPDLKITAHQWWWDVRYLASGAVTANEIHLPAGRKWLVQLESSDVIHDFWVPELAPKMDAIPGHPNFFWIEADSPGTYLGTCAEFCGAQHAWMRLRVTADAPADFERWESEQLAPHPAPHSPSAQRGSQLFAQRTCVSCHAVGATGARLAPDLTHLAGRQTLGAGVLTNTQTNLVRWIGNAQAFKPGSHMPSLALSDTDAEDIASFLVEPP